MTLRVGVWPGDIAVDRLTHRAYVVNTHSSDNSISVIDLKSNSVISAIKVATSPMNITLDPSAKVAYLTHTVSYDNTISVIDLSKNTVKGKIKVGEEAFDPVLLDKKLYVSNSGDNTISVINKEDNKVIDLIMVDSIPLCLAADPVHKKVFVAGQDESSVAVY